MIIMESDLGIMVKVVRVMSVGRRKRLVGCFTAGLVLLFFRYRTAQIHRT